MREDAGIRLEGGRHAPKEQVLHRAHCMEHLFHPETPSMTMDAAQHFATVHPRD